MEIKGKTALVTGASRRIGKALALALAERGAAVGVHYGSDRSADEAKQVAQTIKAGGGRAVTLQCDLTRPERIEAMMSALVSELEHCSILVNCAAMFGADAEIETAHSQFDQQMAVNARAPYLLTRAMLVQKPAGAPGKVINIGDAVEVRPNYVAYGTSKAAISYLTRVMAISAAPDVQVNEIALGYILPPNQTTKSDAQSSKSLFGRSPAVISARRLVARNGAPREVAQAMLALIENDYITGERIRVDGGIHV